MLGVMWQGSFLHTERAAGIFTKGRSSLGSQPRRLPFGPKRLSMSGYVLPAAGSEQIKLDVRCLNGEGCMLSLADSTLGREVHRLVSEQLPSKRGSRLVQKPPRFTTAAPQNIARTGHCRKGCDIVMHLCSNELVCCMELCPIRSL